LSFIWSDLRKRGLSVMAIDCSDPKKMVVKQAMTRRETGRR
jgi:hypothetical protein